MTFQGVPWAVGGNAALNPVEAARLLAYVATRSESGVILPADCQVREQAAPDGTVRVTPGGVAVVNGAAGAGAETYLGRNPEDHVVPITPTGSGAGRSDLVYVRVADPQYAGQPAPADPATGPYIYPEVAAGVLSSTESVEDAITQGVLPAGTTGVALARIDLPASATTVTQAMITDLRKLVAPRTNVESFVTAGAASTLNSTTFVQWPSTATWNLDIPEWATGALVRVEHLGPSWSTETNGYLRVVLAGEAGPSVAFNLSNPSVSGDRGNFVAVGEVPVAEAVRGTSQTLTLEGRVTGGGMALVSSTGCPLLVHVQFVERLEDAA